MIPECGGRRGKWRGNAMGKKGDGWGEGGGTSGGNVKYTHRGETRTLTVSI